MEEATLPPMISRHLVGRVGQLATLQSLVEQAKGGERQMVLISGEAGIGKSRLVAEVKNSAIAQEFLVLQGNCFPTDRTYPYAPLLDLLRALFASPPAILATTDLERLAHDLFPLLPELIADGTAPLLSLEPEQEKHRLFAVLANFFIRLSASSPLLLVIEDIHWSDSTSLDFLHLLTRRMASHPLLLLVTYRQDEIHEKLSSWLVQITRQRLAKGIQLAPLVRNEVDAMLSALFDQRHTALDMRRFLHGELLDTLFTLTEGNPFFVEETLSAMIAAGDIFYVQGYWNRRSLHAPRIPHSVQDAVQQRTHYLGAAAKQVVILAAVAGRQFDFVLLQHFTGYNEEQFLLIMKELVSAQLVIEVSGDQFAFRHALTRQAIYAQLLARERTRVHRTIAEALEHLSSATLDARVEDLAYHFYQAGVWPKTLDYAQRAGEKALRLYSHRAAIDYFTWTIEAAGHLSLPPSGWSPPAAYRARGQAHETLGEFEQAQHDYTLALDAARTIQDRIAEWQSEIDLGFLWAGRDYTQAEPWFLQALALSESLNDPILRARSLNRLGNWHLNVTQPHEALHYHQEALAIFQQLHDAHGIAETLDLLGMTSYLGGDLLGGTAYYQQAIALFQDLEDKPGLTSSLATLTLRAPNYQTDALVSAAGLTVACQDAELALTIARAIGHRSAEAYALLQEGLCLGAQGEYERALQTTKQGLQIAEEIEHRQWQTACHCVLGGIYNSLFAYPQAREHAEQGLALAHETGSRLWKRLATGYLAPIVIFMHDFAQAQKLLDAVLSPDTPAETMAQRMAWCASVELALAKGQPAQALGILDRLSASTTRSSEEQNSLRTLKLRGEALAALQRWAEAETALTAAQTLAAALDARPMQWRICLALGNLYQTQGKSTAAEWAFAIARTLIDELATTITDEALRTHFLRSAMALLPSPRPLSSKQATKQAYGGLTAREREIAALIAQDKSNREIADMLVLSERTVETHVSNIMLKLDFTSRRQIATWAVDKGLAAKE